MSRLQQRLLHRVRRLCARGASRLSWLSLIAENIYMPCLSALRMVPLSSLSASEQDYDERPEGRR